MIWWDNEIPSFYIVSVLLWIYYTRRKCKIMLNCMVLFAQIRILSRRDDMRSERGTFACIICRIIRDKLLWKALQRMVLKCIIYYIFILHFLKGYGFRNSFLDQKLIALFLNQNI